jgi:hypothetical protein
MRKEVLQLPNMISGAATPELSLVVAIVLNPAQHGEQ